MLIDLIGIGEILRKVRTYSYKKSYSPNIIHIEVEPLLNLKLKEYQIYIWSWS